MRETDSDRKREGERERFSMYRQQNEVVWLKETGKPDIWRSARSKEGPMLHPAVAPVIISLFLPSCKGTVTEPKNHRPSHTNIYTHAYIYIYNTQRVRYRVQI